MKEFTTNRFYKGINTDLSLLERQGDVLLDALNVRVTSKNIDGLFAANIKGNAVEFELSKDFVPIGSVEYNGILFILSVNEIKGGSEIGCFPSPNSTGTGGFTNVYAPLFNYTLDNPNEIANECTGEGIKADRLIFRTSDLNFSCKHQARVLARLNFDKSINLYWTDNHNPVRSINTGFHSETGVWNDTYVSQAMIQNGGIDVINESEFIPIVSLNKVDVFGSLKAGHYFFFIRYIDIEFNTTSFLGMSAPVPVFNIKPKHPLMAGSTDTAFGLEAQEITNTNIELDIKNLDPSQGFFEVGYIYYYGIDQYEVKLISNRHSIAANGSATINVLGSETVMNLALDEFIRYKPVDSIYAKDICQLNNKLYLANTRGMVLDHYDLREFCCSIKINEDRSLSKPAEQNLIPATTPGSGTFVATPGNKNPYGIEAKDVYESVGYFSGETYCFAVVPIFKGGFTGSAFPLAGADNYDNLYASTNSEGIYRFKKAYHSPYYENDIAYIKGVTFDTTLAQGIYNNSTWLQENLIGLYFCRAERNKNLQYQGISVPLYRGGELFPEPHRDFLLESILQPPFLALDGENHYKNWDTYIPIMERAAPYIFTIRNPYVFTERGVTSYQKYAVTHAADETNDCEKNRPAMGILSFDHLIDEGMSQEGVTSSSHIEKIGEIEDAGWWPRAPYRTVPGGVEKQISAYYPDGISADGTNVNFGTSQGTSFIKMFVQKDLTYLHNYADTKGGGYQADTYNVKPWDANGININNKNYVSKVDEGNDNNGLFWYHKDRQNAEDEWLHSLPFATPGYILVDLDSVKPDNNFISTLIAKDIDTWFNTIVNVYKQRPDSDNFNYLSFYDFKNTLFSPISDFIPISSKSLTISTDIKDLASNVYYQGDCFVSRSYIKVQHKRDDNLSSDFLSNIGAGQAHSDIGANGIMQPTYPQQQKTSWFFENMGFGYGVSIVTENVYNPNYRHEKGRNHFFPKNHVFFDPMENITDSPESNFYNPGYTRMLSPRAFLGIDKLKPISDNSFPTRIRPSFTHILNSLKDGYLEFTPGDFKDFEFQYGPINALMSMNDQLFSFQNDAINLHPINERAVAQSDGTDTPFILGESRELTEYKKAMSSEYGTQHQWSIIKGERAIYGFDWNKQVFWRVSGQGFQDLGLLKGCEKWIEDVAALQSSGVTDIREQLPDNPVCNQGIHSVYDREYKEVITTFIFGENKNKTICFSEKNDNFGSKYSFTPVFYSELEKDLYSFKDGKFWRHDANPLHDNFYGLQYTAFIEVVVNPKGEIAKHFDNLIINSNNVEFDKIKYKTQHQTAEQLNFLGEFWNRAVYREEQWKLPIRRADSISDSNLSLAAVKSRMRGRYLIINLEYAGSEDMWIREIITAYTQSKA